MSPLYPIFNTIGSIALVLYNFLNFRKKKMILGKVSNSVIAHFDGKPKTWYGKILSSFALWTILEICIICVAQYLGVGFLNSGASRLFNTGANYFGVLYGAPFVVLLVCLLLRIDYLAQMDLITPAYPLALVFVKIACHFGCCCCGVPWENGVYNPLSRQIEFPSQFLESGVALLLFVALFVFRKRFKKGTVFPIYLMSYSAIRFFTEFTRAEPAVFLGLKTYHFLCIAGVILGVVEYILVRLHDKKQCRAS